MSDPDRLSYPHAAAKTHRGELGVFQQNRPQGDRHRTGAVIANEDEVRVGATLRHRAEAGFSMKASRGLSVDLAQNDLEPRELLERLGAPDLPAQRHGGAY